jgi:hypothetical protein
MKRIKFMLTSLALFAVVGGALAFKARFATSYCTAPTVANQACNIQTCPNLVVNSTTVGANAAFVCTTLAPNADCTTLDPEGNVTDATCGAISTSLKGDQ